MGVVMCKSSTHVSESEMTHVGVLYMDDHPVVIQHPDLFDRDLEKYAIGYAPPVIETATAAPGEIRRGPGRPRKDSYVGVAE